jgi:hypothetical protein
LGALAALAAASVPVPGAPGVAQAAIRLTTARAVAVWRRRGPQKGARCMETPDGKKEGRGVDAAMSIGAS